MTVGVLRVTIHIPAAGSLKDKRSIVRRAVDRLKNRFNLAVAEVGALNDKRHAVLAAVTVNTDGRQANSTLDRALAALDSLGDFVIAAHEIELIPFGDYRP